LWPVREPKTAKASDIKAGVDIDALAARLQSEEADSFVNSWNDLTGVISSKAAALGKSTTPEAVS
jgi:transaldolase